MPRISEFNDKFLYTRTDPNNIVAAPKGALFFRRGENFYFCPSGNLNSHWERLLYRTVVTPVPDDDKPIYYEHPYELWEKKSAGFKNDQRELLPKTDWKLLSYEDVFITRGAKALHWIFPPPVNTVDPRGTNDSRSYDENFFYAKLANRWTRTPITVYTDPMSDPGEVSYWYNNLPFTDIPRVVPMPHHTSSAGSPGDQTYDTDFFYVKPSMWKRVLLTYFTPSKMTEF